MKNANELGREELAEVVAGIQVILFLDIGPEGDRWNSEKEWDTETLEAVADTLEEHGLRPAPHAGPAHGLKPSTEANRPGVSYVPTETD